MFNKLEKNPRVSICILPIISGLLSYLTYYYGNDMHNITAVLLGTILGGFTITIWMLFLISFEVWLRSLYNTKCIKDSTIELSIFCILFIVSITFLYHTYVTENYEILSLILGISFPIITGVLSILSLKFIFNNFPIKNEK